MVEKEEEEEGLCRERKSGLEEKVEKGERGVTVWWGGDWVWKRAIDDFGEREREWKK